MARGKPQPLCVIVRAFFPSLKISHAYFCLALTVAVNYWNLWSNGVREATSPFAKVAVDRG
jgi:hypothetical protein